MTKAPSARPMCRQLALEQAHQADEEQRERPVELRLDGEAPRVLQRARRLEDLAVGRVREDELPVGHVEERGGTIDADGPPLAQRSDGGGHERRERHTERSSREEATQSALPELEEPNPAPGPELRDEQPRDEEPAQGEERRHGEGTARHPTHATVEEEHGRDGHGSQAVEPGHVGQLRRTGRPPLRVRLPAVRGRRFLGPPLRRREGAHRRGIQDIGRPLTS